MAKRADLLKKRVGSRIEPDKLTPESHQAVSHIRAAVHKVFLRQHDRARIATDRLIKSKGSLLAKRKFQSVQFNLSPEDAKQVLELPVLDYDFADKGREKVPHVTVLFGLHKEVTIEEVNRITEGIGDVEIVLLDLHAFPPGEDGEPLVMRVESEQLKQLHSDLLALPNSDSHPEYVPHITIGYIKPGMAATYVALGNPLEGETFVLKELKFSAIDHSMTDLKKRYSSVEEVPSYVPKSGRRQWLHVFNSEWDRHKTSSQEERERISFSAANGVVGRRAKKAYADPLRKIDEEEAAIIADRILEELEAEWAALPAEVRDQLVHASLSGVAQGMLQIEFSSAGMIAQANNIAQDYAVNRAAELVGMSYDGDGNLIPNPDAKWAISDTTRDAIREIVTEAFQDKTTIREVKDAIQKALEDEATGMGIFSEARADMISRTEVMRAQVRGNVDVWQQSGLVQTVKWLTAEDEKVCPECEGNDGVVVELGEPFPDGSTMPTAHPYCRCVLVVESVSE